MVEGDASLKQEVPVSIGLDSFVGIVGVALRPHKRDSGLNYILALLIDVASYPKLGLDMILIVGRPEVELTATTSKTSPGLGPSTRTLNLAIATPLSIAPA